MGTRCDFYTVNDTKKLVWVGSYGWDGNPGGVQEMMGIHKSTSQGNYVKRIVDYLKANDGYIAGEDGWPWPWETSATTDYYYIFHEDKVYVGAWGGELVEINIYLKHEDSICEEEDGFEEYFSGVKFELPDMSKIQKVDYGKGSGIMVFGGPAQRISKDEFKGKLYALFDEYGGVASCNIKYKDDEVKKCQC